MPQPGTYMARPLTQGTGNLGMDYMGSDSWLYGNSPMGGGYLPNYMNSATNSLFPTSNVGGSALSNITGNTGNQFTLPNYTSVSTSGGGSSGGAPFPITPIPQTQPMPAPYIPPQAQPDVIRGAPQNQGIWSPGPEYYKQLTEQRIREGRDIYTGNLPDDPVARAAFQRLYPDRNWGEFLRDPATTDEYYRLKNTQPQIAGPSIKTGEAQWTNDEP